jgi:NADPH:quinone reductase-like Zn-dependent oxidoreductase
MKLRYKIGIGFVLLIALAILGLGIALSHESPCPPQSKGSVGISSMKAYRYYCYGSPEVLRLEGVEKPQISDSEVLVRVRAASVNPLDWHYMRGEPYLMRLMAGMSKPEDPRLGVDFSGTVREVGANVTRFRPGDEVFGGAAGAFGEYVKFDESRGVALKPANISFKEAASVAIAGVTALQGLRDAGQLRAGQRVLINGASGGVGTFAVQIAKAIGAEVTGVCSTRNVEMVYDIGADHVIDYTSENFTEQGVRYDLIFDMVGNHSLGDLRRVMEPEGTLVIVGASSTGQYIGPLWRPMVSRLMDPFVSQNFENFLARLRQDDMVALAELMRAGEVTPVIDRSYSFYEVPDAIRYSEEGHARGKIVIDIR